MKRIFVTAMFMMICMPAAANTTLLPEWSYEGLSNGQDSWSYLSPAYALCEGGTKQSPVVIAYTQTSNLPSLEFRYQTEDLTLLATPQMMRMTMSGKSELLIDKTAYKLMAAEFHSPSEHMIRGQFYPMEIYLLHQNAAGQKLNIAIFVEKANERESLSHIISKLPQAIGSSANAKFDFNQLLPSSFGYYAYQGSMTTPPCTEDVEWRVLKRPINMSEKQIEAITKLHGRSARLEQPIYGRTIYETAY